MPLLKFTEHAATVHYAIVASLDLVGFSDFCNQPEAPIVVPKLAKHFFDLLNNYMNEEDSDYFFFKGQKSGKLSAPECIKFTGDGALMFWVQDRREDISQKFCDLVVRSMRDFQRQLADELPECEKQWRVRKLPKRVRVGIASGSVYALRKPHIVTSWSDPVDYVGYCVNLAVRLQSYCSDLGFLVQGNLQPDLPGMEYFEATNLKGSQPERVALFSDDARRVSKEEFNQKFK